MQLLVDSTITESGISAPAAVLVHNIEEPLRRSPLLVPKGKSAHGLAFDAANQISNSTHSIIRLHSFDEYEEIPCSLHFITADKFFSVMNDELPQVVGSDLSAGELIYGMRVLDCKAVFKVLTIFGASIIDMPDFRILPSTGSVLISVFGSDYFSNDLIAQSVVELLRANTTVTNVEPLDTLIVNHRP